MKLRIPRGGGSYTELTRCLGGWRRVRRDYYGAEPEWVSTRFAFHEGVDIDALRSAV